MARGSGKPSLEPDEAQPEPDRPWMVNAQRPPTGRGQRTRSKVLAAAEGLFSERYFTDVTVMDIAEASGLSVGTLYSYFENKEDVFFELLSRAFVEMYEEARRAWPEGADYRESVRSTTVSYVAAYWRNRQMMRSAYYLAATNERARSLLWAWRRDLETQMHKRLVQDQADSKIEALNSVILIRVLQSAVDEYVRRAYADEEFGPAHQRDLEASAEVLAEVWYRAIFGDADASSGTGKGDGFGCET